MAGTATKRGAMRSTARGALFALIWALSCQAGSAAVHARVGPARTRSIWSVPSPDRKHRVELCTSGQLALDGQRIPLTGTLLGRPAWRRDGRALAFLQRSGAGMQLLIVLLDVDPLTPLVWSLPSLTTGTLREVFWIGPQRVGIGEKMLVPRVVVSWTTVVA